MTSDLNDYEVIIRVKDKENLDIALDYLLEVINGYQGDTTDLRIESIMRTISEKEKWHNETNKIVLEDLLSELEVKKDKSDSDTIFKTSDYPPESKVGEKPRWLK